jgi:hypothetical protein
MQDLKQKHCAKGHLLDEANTIPLKNGGGCRTCKNNRRRKGSSPIPRRPQEDRFWDNVDKSTGLGPTGDCWLWRGWLQPNGYGRGRFDGKNRLAHRVSYQLANGSITEGHYICHRCDTPACVNPAHLFSGTPEVNVQDMMAKGRNANGSKSTVKGGQPNA